MRQKTSGGVQQFLLPQTRADRQSDVSRRRTHTVRQGPRGTRDVWRENKKDSTDSEESLLGWLA